ncbi:MAG: radical SAM protein [Dehalococcoidia bacterium]|nr:radical SAM protein [Dehalococcoidia bacterium]
MYPAQTLASTGSVLRQLGYKVMAMDMAAWQGTPDLAAKVVRSRKWCAVMVFISHVTLEYDLNFARLLRQLTPCPPTVLLGPATRFLKPELDRSPADAAILGEPEKTLLEAHESIFSVTADGGPLLFFGDGEEGFVEDLESLPFPAWDLVPPGKGAFLTVYGSKGCPRRCTYCPYVVAQGRRVRARSVERVIQEIEWLVESFSINRIMFRDIAFARDGEWVESFCRALIKKKLRLRWECESHPMDFHPDLLGLMKQAGCIEIKVGLETAHRGLLQEWARVGSSEEAGAYLAHVAGIQETCRRIGVRCHLFLMVGVPGQGEESAQITFSYLQRLHPELVNVKLFHPYPGIAMEGNASDQQEATIQSQLLRSCQVPAQNGQSRFFPRTFNSLLRKHSLRTNYSNEVKQNR